MRGLNARLALAITNTVGTMWMAYAFTTLALVSLPAAILSRSLIVLVAWIAQTFLQLVLLPIIIVGQNIQAASVNKKITETHTASLAEFQLAKDALAAHREEMAELKALLNAVHAQVTDGPAAT